MPTRTGLEGESSRTREGVRRGSLGEGGRGAGRREQPRMMRWTRAVGRAELAAEATKTAGDGGRREDESGGRGRGHGGANRGHDGRRHLPGRGPIVGGGRAVVAWFS